MTDRSSILRRLEDESNSPRLRRLRGLLERDDTRLIANLPSKVSVAEALRLWTTRLKNTDVTGQRLDGAHSLVTRLKALTPQRKLEQFALVGRDATGNVFFDGSTHHFVGAIIIEKDARASSL
ncbi:MAG TPA: hypothetical protein VII58_05275 [Acidobacteriaceae bacterium]